MYKKRFVKACILFLFSGLLSKSSLLAQSTDCNFKSPIIRIDFGDDNHPQDFSLSQLKGTYRRINGVCPDDGQYTFTSHTENCFFGNWLTFTRDHTPGSINGRMMIVNASYKPSSFFSIVLADLRPNTQYELSAWLVNVCPGNQGCEPTPPRIRISAFADGKLLTSFFTGAISPGNTINWQRYAGMFTTPASFSSIAISMDDLTSGGCGNDFALDDIEIRECRTIIPVRPPAPRPEAVVVKKTVIPEIKEQPKPATTAPRMNTSDVAVKKPDAVINKDDTGVPVLKTLTPAVALPEVLKKRDNPVVKAIETPASEITIELYDNGEIDGDTVTIFHNNKMVVSHAGLSTKPVTVKLRVDENEPHHELVMVADNLGSIPPNTSLMVVTTKYKRYEVFISSTEQKNARVVIDLEKQ